MASVPMSRERNSAAPQLLSPTFSRSMDEKLILGHEIVLRSSCRCHDVHRRHRLSSSSSVFVSNGMVMVWYGLVTVPLSLALG